ncbi:MAG: hypothetical protein M3680_07440 [Myxococcota bacterium]|nr:hypothetical protein [Myxococcota bacterium]
MRAAAVIVALAGCASFEDPTIVLDLRVLAIQAEPPEIILDVDPARPPDVAALFAQLEQQPILLRALLTEPGHTRDLEWEMSACMLAEGGRCDDGRPRVAVASGLAADPESTGFVPGCGERGIEEGGVVCAMLVPDAAFATLLYDALRADPTGGLGGLDVGIALQVGARGADGATAGEVHASKLVRIAPRIPAERIANTNPHIEELLFGGGIGVGTAVPRSHCASSRGASPDVRSGQVVTLYPTARDGDREEYVVPTLDGATRRFTEYLSYQWIAIAGSFSDPETGGPPDPFGNVRLDGTEWTAPAVAEPTDISIWVIQRDGRFGVTWRETCLQVIP